MCSRRPQRRSVPTPLQGDPCNGSQNIVLASFTDAKVVSGLTMVKQGHTPLIYSIFLVIKPVLWRSKNMSAARTPQTLVSLIYSSDATVPFEATSLGKLAELSARSNAGANITGYLSYRGTRFTQYLEGPEAAVNDLIARVRSDNRHKVRTLAWLEITERRFEGWSMRLLDPLWLPTSGTLDAIDELLGSVGPGEISNPLVAENMARLVEAI